MTDLSWLPSGWGAILAEFQPRQRNYMLTGDRGKNRPTNRPKNRRGVLYSFHAEIDGTAQQAREYARELGKQGYKYLIDSDETHRIFTNGAGYK